MSINDSCETVLDENQNETATMEIKELTKELVELKNKTLTLENQLKHLVQQQNNEEKNKKVTDLYCHIF